MSLTERFEKIKPWLWPINLVLVGTLAFGLGRWSKIEESKTPVLIENPIPVGETATNTPTVVTSATSPSAKNFVASKNGKKYYYPRCAGASRIKEENKIWFATKEEALGKGYTPATNCPGL